MKIVRSKRKTIALVIDFDGSLIVRAPLRTSRAIIEQLVFEKTDWIQERQEWIRQRSGAPHHFEEGEHFYYLGKAYPLQYANHIHLPLFLSDKFHLNKPLQTHAKNVFLAWYRDQACQIIGERTFILAKHHYLVYKQIRITSARTRWGSCSSSGTLNFSWRLVMAPLEVIDYVIAHELAHLKIPNHSIDFWKFVAQLSPEYRTHRKWLKENGGKLYL